VASAMLLTNFPTAAPTATAVSPFAMLSILPDHLSRSLPPSASDLENWAVSARISTTNRPVSAIRIPSVSARTASLLPLEKLFERIDRDSLGSGDARAARRRQSEFGQHPPHLSPKLDHELRLGAGAADLSMR